MNLKLLMTRLETFVFLFIFSSLFLFANKEVNPVANPDAVVTSGNMRFTVLTPRLIRIQYSANKQFEDRATFTVVNRNLEVPAFTTETSGGYLYIKTSALTLRYLLTSVPTENDCSPKNLSVTYNMNGQECTWYPGKDDAMNLKGTCRTLDRAWGDAQRNDLEKGLLSRAGCSIIDESPRAKRGDGSTTFALEETEDGFPWVKEPIDKSATDWYFMGYGHDYKQALSDYTKIAGKVPMPPKYIFGYWYSRYWGYTQNEFIGLVTDFEKYNIPIDVMIMDMDWHKSGWTGWSWNKNLIPNPNYLIKYFHQHGLKTALNLHPADGIANYEDNYQIIKEELGYPASYNSNIPWKLEDYAFYKSFFKNLMRVREKEGVDFWWLDWQQWLTSPYTEGLSETFWANHVYYNDMALNRTSVRPVIYHRWGGLGSHRYPIGFSGDTFAAWSTLAYEIPFTSTASNVCYAYWGHDLGGHQGGNNDPELMQRWLQFGVFSPIFRTHATNDGRLERRLWKYKNFDQLRETVRLRYRLFPYIYTAARVTYETGVGMNRPLYYDYPEEANSYNYEDEYMFGDDILVAPIYTPSEDGLSTRKIWLPKGEWWDVTANCLRNGNSTITGSYTTDEFPYFYKAGSVVVNYPTQRTVQETPDTIVLKVVPGAEGSGRFYEDAGDDQNYQNETGFANTYFRQTRTESSITLFIYTREGTFEGIPQKRVWNAQFLGIEDVPSSVRINGEATENYQFDKDSKVLSVNTVMGDASAAVNIEVETSSAYIESIGEEDVKTEVGVYDAGSQVSGQLWITGSAVPQGTQQLEAFPDGTFKFHGRLVPGELYIQNSETAKSTTRYCKPNLTDANIVCDVQGYTSGYKNNGAAWTVLFEADNYRFTVNPSTMSVKGEIHNPWYESWIVGGCTGSGQSEKWLLEKGLPMVQSAEDPYIWTFVGELKTIAGNSLPNMLKINGQYDWGPKTMRPFGNGAILLNSTQAYYNNPNDYKWQIGEDGYYMIQINTFLETINSKYLGKVLPDGVETTEGSSLRLTTNGLTVCVTADDLQKVELVSISGVNVANAVGNNMSLQAPKSGIYVVRCQLKTKSVTYKISIK